ncbi:MAG: tandem-95 repeat protein [Chloroflexi bacterium]|nr:tandem-95 repeat protein [Chloroflexota bacterium]
MGAGADVLLENNTFQNNSHAVFFDLINSSGQITLRHNTASGNAVNGAGIQGAVGGVLALDWTEQEDFALRLNSDLTVNTAATLDLSPNTIIKATQPFHQVAVNGRLLAQGTADQPIVFTSQWDDRYGGDTNNDGPSNGAPGNWGQVYFAVSSSGNVLDHCVVAYGGNRGYSHIFGNLRADTKNITLTNCTIEHSHEYGLYTSNAPLQITGSVFQNNAYAGLRFDNLGTNSNVSLANNAFLNNGDQALFLDFVNASGQVTLADNVVTNNVVNGAGVQGTIAGNLTLDWHDQTGFALRLYSDLTVNNGATLTLSPNTVFKSSQPFQQLVVHGRLVADGTAAQPIVFTSLWDDRYSGDTNNDGSATAPAPGNWGQLYFSATSSGNVLDYCVVAYGGNRGYSDIVGNVRANTGSIALTNCTIEHSHEAGLFAINSSLHISNTIFRNNAFTGLDFNQLGPAADILLENNTFQNNSHAVFFDLVNSSGQITLRHNTASGNAVNGAGIQGAIGGALALNWNDQPAFALRLNSDLTVNNGAVLDLSPGVVFKATQPFHQVAVNGRLLAQGTADQPIVFTSQWDDRYGGDTNNDGSATAPAPGNWGQLYFSATSSGNVLDHCVVAYGGNRGYSHIFGNVRADNNDVAITHCTIEHSHEHGLYFGGSAAPPPLSGNRIENNSFNGLFNAGSVTIDARHNWWGHASGPFHPTLNPAGQGNQVSNNVLFDPWLTLLASFTAAPLSGSVPLTVTFADASPGNVTGWLWDFGDGLTSTLQSPAHIYTLAGVYSVVLTVSGPGGSDTLTRTNYIVASAPLIGGLPAEPVARLAALDLLANSPLPTNEIMAKFSVGTRFESRPAQQTITQTIPPPLASSFYGPVTVGGDNVPAGTVVSAWINGVQYATAPAFLEDGRSVYRLDLPGDLPETTAVEGGQQGQLITFKVGGAAAAPAAVWQTGTYVSHTLTTTFGLDLVLAAAGLPATVLPGETLTYTFTISNAGAQTAGGVLLRSQLSPHVTFLSASGGGAAGGSAVTWPAVTLNGGATTTRQLVVRVVAPLPAGVAAITNTTTVNHDGAAGLDPTPGNNTVSPSATADASPDLQITKQAGAAAVTPGDLLVYTLTITNTGTQGASGVVVSDTLPAGVTFLNASDSGLENAGLVTWPPFTLPAGQSASRTITVQLHPLPPLSTTVAAVTNTATVADDGANGPDGNPAGNTASLTTPVVRQPDLTVPAVATGPAAIDPQTLIANGDAAVQLQNAGNAALAEPFTVTLFEDSNGNGAFSPGADNMLGQGVYNSTLAIGQAVTFTVPLAGSVSFRDNPIYAYADSDEIIAELNENNNLNNTANSCLYVPAPGVFSPIVELSWPQPGVVEPESKDTLSTPLVVNLTDDNGDGQINDGDVPDIVFITADLSFFSAPTMLRAIKGDTGEAIFDVPQFYYYPSYRYFIYTMPGLAAGDIDNDGKPEIILSSLVFNLHPLSSGVPTTRLVAFEHTGARKWFTADYVTHPQGQPTNRDNPTIADLDGDGTPEIIVGANVFNNNGHLRWSGSGGQAFQSARNQDKNDSGAISIVANLDMAGNPELVTGNTAYRSDGSIYWQVPYDDGYPAVANFDDDGYPEIVVVARGRIRLHEHDGTLIWGPFILPSTTANAGGAPTIADFDADGQPEIGVAGADRYVVYETDGSLKWQTTTQDASSNMTGSTVFDLDGDGNFEVLYRDERRFRIYRGSDGVVLYEHILSSETMNEEVVVADVDADGNAEILVTSDRARRVPNIPNAERTFGLRVFGDANDNWVSARPIWNQHAYHIDNVNDDGAIPTQEAFGWLTHNTYRANVGPAGQPRFGAPDLTASRITVNLDNFPLAVVGARIGNGGAAVVPAGTPVAFYDGNPGAGGTLIGVLPLEQPLLPGQYLDVSLEWTMPGLGSGVITVVADDDGAGQGQHSECREGNNAHSYAYDTAVLGLVLTKDDGRSLVSSGDTLTYTLTVFNAFAGSASGVILTDTLPANTTFVSASNGGTVADGVVAWPAFSLAAGQAATRSLVVQVNQSLPISATEITNLATVSDDGANGPDQTPANNSASDVDALTTVQADAGGPYTGDEGQAILLDASGSADRDGTIVSYTWDLDGDGQYDDAGGLTTTVTFPDNGSFTIGLQVTDDDGEQDTDTAFVSTTNLPPAVQAAPDPAFDEGRPATHALATFSDPGQADSHTATIDWGDGTVAGGALDGDTIRGTHTYTDDGTYSVEVCLTDDDGGQSCATLQALVANEPPVVEAGPDVAATAGETVQLAPATFTDPGVNDTHTATIDWGDGTVAGGLVSQGGTVGGSHVYTATAVFLVELCVTDDDGDTGCDTFFVNLVDLAVAKTDGRPAVQPGDAITYTLTVTNAGTLAVNGVTLTDTLPAYTTFINASAGGNYNAAAGQITWLLGALTPGQVATRTLTLKAEASPPPAVIAITNTVTVADDGANGPDMRLANNQAGDVDTLLSVRADPGGPYSGDEGQPILLDASASSDRNGVITGYAWDLDGDGQYDDASGVTATVTLADDGQFLVHLRVTDNSGESDTATAAVAVNNAAPAVTANTSLAVTEGDDLNQVIATFTDPGANDTHTATVNWGDGTVEEALVAGASGGGDVFGAHTYPDDGTYNVEICVADDDGGVGCDILALGVQNGVPFILDTLLTDFRLWTDDELLSCYDPSPRWEIAADGQTVTQTVNSRPGVFYGEFSAYETRIEGTVHVFTENLTTTAPFLDDDYVGFVLGYQPGDLNDPQAEYLLVDWKSGQPQGFAFGCGGYTEAQPGLAISRVFGSPADSEMWGHLDHTCNGPGHGVEELARAATLGAAGWDYNTDYEFAFELSATNLKVFVNGSLELDLDGDFAYLAAGRFGFYTYSQADAVFRDFHFQSITVDEGSPLTLDSIFSDPGILDTHTATIDWGDGTVVSGTITEASGAGVVSSGHTYADGDAAYTMQLCLSDDDGGTNCQETDVNVRNVAPTVAAGPDLTATAGETISLTATTFSDPGVLDSHTATINWGDGAVVSGTVSELNGSGTVSASHVYAADGVYTVEICLTDDDGATGCDAFQVNRVDLAITKSDGQTVARPGETLTYTLTINNASNLTVTNVMVGDILPAHTTFLAASDGGAYHANGHVVVWEIPALGPAAALTRTVTVRVNSPLPPATGVITNTAIVADDGAHGPEETSDNNTALDVNVIPAGPVAHFAPAKGLNAAQLADGASIAGASSVWNSSSLYQPENAIDHDPASRWRTANGQPANQSLTVALLGGNVHVIDQVTLQGPAGPASPRHFAIRVSTNSPAETDFTTILTGTLPQDGVLHTYPFAPVQARYVQLLLLDNWGNASYTEVYHFTAQTRDRQGGVVSLLEGGASVAAASSQSSNSSLGPEKAIDFSPTTYWETAAGQTTNQWIKVALFDGNTHLIDRVRIRAVDGDATPQEFQVRVSNGSLADADFVPVFFGALPRDGQDHWITFPAVPAKYVQLYILNNHGHPSVTRVYDFQVYTPALGGPAVPFDDLSGSPDSQVVAWRWDFGDGTTAGEQHPSHTFAAPGTYTVTLVITDANGLPATTARSYTVLPRPVASFTWSPPLPNEGQATAFADTSTASGAIVGRQWQFTHTATRPTTPNTSATFPDDGDFPVTLIVTDTQLVSGSLTLIVPVGNVTPTVDIGPASIIRRTGDLVLIPGGGNFRTVNDASAIDLANLAYAWDLGDGRLLTTPTVNYSYPAAGAYTVTLTVTDPQGASASDSMQVVVYDDHTAPTPVVELVGSQNAALLESANTPSLLAAGATVVAYSSRFSTSFVPENLLDLDTTVSTWASANGQTTNQSVVIRLAGDQLPTIDQVLVQPRADSSFDQRVKDFEVWVSTTTADPWSFTRVLAATAADNGNLQPFLFPGGPVQARYVKLVALNNRGSGCCISVTTFQVVAAGAPPPGGIVAVSSQADAGHRAELLLDPTTRTFWRSATGQTTNQWVKLLLAGGQSHTVHGLSIQPVSGSESLRDFLVQVSNTTSDDAAFTTVYTGTAQSNGQLQHFFFADVQARYVRLVALNNHGSTCCISIYNVQVRAEVDRLADGWFNSDVLVRLSAEENPGGSGVTLIEYSTNSGSTWLTFAQPFLFSTHGSTPLSVRARDLVGNISQPLHTAMLIDKSHKLTSQEAGQAGANWLATAVKNESTSLACVACHVQGDSLHGLSLGASTGLVIDTGAGSGLGWLANFITNPAYQNPNNGLWGHPPGQGSFQTINSSHSLFGLAMYDRFVSTDKTANLLLGVNAMLPRQAANGRWPIDQHFPPTNQGDIEPTVHMLFALNQARQRVDPTTAAQYQATIDAALNWLRTAPVSTNQDKALKLIGLVEAGLPRSDPLVTGLIDTVLAGQFADGGWAENSSFTWTSSFATGQSVYALCAAGVSRTHPQVVQGLDWLIHHQVGHEPNSRVPFGVSDGPWPLRYTGAGQPFVSTMWPVIALACYGDFSFVLEATPAFRVLTPGLAVSQTATYTVTVGNTGVAIDTYHLAVTGGLPGWQAGLSAPAVTLAIGSQTTLTLTVVAPAGLPQSLSVPFSVIARSQNAPALVRTALVEAVTSPPPTQGHPTNTTIVAGDGLVAPINTPIRLAATVLDTVSQAGVAGPDGGVVNFRVAGVAVGGDTDADGDGVFEITWTPGPDWISLGPQDLRAIYSGLDRPAPAIDLLPSFDAGSLTINDAVDLVLAKDDGQVTVLAGDVLTYVLTVHNHGTLQALGVVLTDTLPAHTTFVSASHGASLAGGLVTWPAFDLAAGNTATRTLAVQLDSPLPAGAQAITNTATVADDGAHGPDPTPANNTATIATPLFANHAPLAVDDPVTTPEDTAVTIPVLANDSDPDGDPLAVVALTQPGNGLAVLNPNGAVTYTPDADFNSTDSASGTDNFTYTITDGQGQAATATVLVTVTPVNDPPVAADDAATTNEDTPVAISVLANDHDVDGDPLAITAVTTPTHGLVVANADGTITYTPAANFSGADSFTYTVADGQGGADLALVAVTVAPVNDPPLAAPDAATTPEDTAVTLDVLANDGDLDGDALSVTAVTAPANGSAVANADGTVTYTPAANFHGLDSFTYTAADGHDGMATALVTVTVTPVNDPPQAADDAVAVAEDTAVAIPVLANDGDLDGDPLSVTAVATPAHGTAATNPGGTITYTPAASYNGLDTFTYTIADGQGGSDTAAVTVTVTAENDNPVAAADSAATPEDTAVTLDVLANDGDVDGDPLAVTAVTTPTAGLVVVNPDNTLTVTPAANFHGSDSFVYTISDGQGGSDTATVTLTVTPVNDPPLAANDTAATNEDLPVTIDVLANDGDVDGDALAVTAVTTPTHGLVVANPDGSLTYTPDANFYGSDAFIYTVNDGQGGTDMAVVAITVAPVNDAPLAANDTAATNEDLPVTIPVLANDSDLDGDPLVVTAVTTPANGLVAANPDGTLTYTPTADFHGADSFLYTIEDGQGGADTATVTLAVNPVNDDPLAADDSAATDEDTAVTINVLANDSDVDGDPLAVTGFTTPTHGLVVLNPDHTFTYTPGADYTSAAAPDRFTYTIADGHGAMDTATVWVIVNPVNDPPVAADDAAVTEEDKAVTIEVLANDSDVDGDSLFVASLTQPLHGTAGVNLDSTVTYTPEDSYFGPDTFTYTIDDGSGGSATATVAIFVTSQNDNPVAEDDSAATDEDKAVTIDVLANDKDVDGDPLAVTAVTTPTHGLAVVNADGAITYTPTANYYGLDSFTYTISDGNGGADTALVTVTVNPVNDDPLAAGDSAATTQDTAVTIPVLANDSDVDGDPLAVTAVTQPLSGAVATNPDGALTYTPQPGFIGLDTFTYTVEDGQGGSDTATVTVTVTPAAGACELYPIALQAGLLAGANPGDVLADILNGEGPGNFGWLTWTGDNSVSALVASLVPPGNSHTYLNPNDPGDHLVSLDDWVEGKPGLSNAQPVRDALDALILREIIVPVWDVTQGAGANATYHVVAFARVRLLSYHLPGQDRITVQFLGYTTCGGAP